MIDHVTIPVSNIERSKEFYEKAFQPLGFKISFGEEGTFWAFDLGNGYLFEIAKAGNNEDITGIHVAFRAPSHEKVRAFYEAAIAAGARDNGEPGPRP